MKIMRLVVVSVMLLGLSALAHSQTLDFTLGATSANGTSALPHLTWSTSPAATSCTASGGVGWAGTKAPSGDATLQPVTTSQAYVLACSWPGVNKATLVWTKPTTNTDGSAYTDPNGYRIQYGTSATNLATSVYITEAQSTPPSWQSPTLAAGTWYFGLRTVNSLGLESALSNVASKSLTADATQSRTLGLSITFPNAPVMSIQ